MALDRDQDLGLREIDELRPEILRHTVGAFLLGYELQSQMADIRGGVASGNFDICHVLGRVAVMTCLSIRSLARTGNYYQPGHPEPVTYSPFAGLRGDEIEAAMSLVRRCAECEDTAAFSVWLNDLVQFAKASEQALSLGDEAPELRSRGGIFWLIRLARTWDRLGQTLGLPSAIPKSWRLDAVNHG